MAHCKPRGEPWREKASEYRAALTSMVLGTNFTPSPEAYSKRVVRRPPQGTGPLPSPARVRSEGDA